MSNLKPRIYVACLAAYNNGYLHGAWIDADLDVDCIYDEINAMLMKSPISHAEEFAIHDFEDFGGVEINEYDGLEKVSELAKFIVNHDELGAAVLAYTSGDIERANRLLEECYHGEFKNEEEFAYYWMHEIDGREIPDYLEPYIDYKAMAHDFFIDGFLAINVCCKIHVFSDR